MGKSLPFVFPGPRPTPPLSKAPPSDEEHTFSPSTRRGREGGLADELGGGAGELPARSSVSEANGGGAYLTDVPEGRKTQCMLSEGYELFLRFGN